MPNLQAITVFANTDVSLIFTLYNTTETQIVDASGWALSWIAKPTLQSETAAITKTTASGTITITGIYNADPDLNAQIIKVSLTDDDTVTLSPGKYFWELKRTDNMFESVLATGIMLLQPSLHTN